MPECSSEHPGLLRDEDQSGTVSEFSLITQECCSSIYGEAERHACLVRFSTVQALQV